MGIPYAEVIGDPIAHSKSPLIHKFWLEKLEIEGDYRAVRLSREELPDYLESRRADPDWRGCNVTMPHKESVLDHVDHVEDLAAKVAASNCVLGFPNGLVATNTDEWGLLHALGFLEAKGPIIVIGAGGAARTTLSFLRSFNAVEVHVFGRDKKKARNLLDQFGLDGSGWHLDERPQLPAPMLLINASPLGMTGFPPMLPGVFELVDQLTDDARLLDLIYEPRRTPLVAAARERGLWAANGLGVLVGQASYAFNLLFRQWPGHDQDDELMERLIQ